MTEALEFGADAARGAGDGNVFGVEFDGVDDYLRTAVGDEHVPLPFAEDRARPDQLDPGLTFCIVFSADSVHPDASRTSPAVSRRNSDAAYGVDAE